jgi:hypothetical protein
MIPSRRWILRLGEGAGETLVACAKITPADSSQVVSWTLCSLWVPTRLLAVPREPRRAESAPPPRAGRREQPHADFGSSFLPCMEGRSRPGPPPARGRPPPPPAPPPPPPPPPTGPEKPDGPRLLSLFHKSRACHPSLPAFTPTLPSAATPPPPPPPPSLGDRGNKSGRKPRGRARAREPRQARPGPFPKSPLMAAEAREARQPRRGAAETR